MIPLFRVIKPGVYCTLQDQGRFGYRRFGMPTAGPMDIDAFQWGHKIIGNEKNENALELFVGGLALEVLTDHRIVITGADLTPMIDGEKIPLWKSFCVWKGQILSFKGPVDGGIAYIIPKGGFHSTSILSSQSMYPKGGIGDSLKKDAVLHANCPKKNGFNSRLRPSEIPQYTNDITVEIWDSPHMDLFDETSIRTFFESTYSLRGGDRMGYYFEGPSLAFKESSDIISEATQFGTIQIPSNGQPIILMADAQTVGGYATIGKVADKDLAKVAQLRSGGKVRFRRKRAVQ